MAKVKIIHQGFPLNGRRNEDFGDREACPNCRRGAESLVPRSRCSRRFFPRRWNLLCDGVALAALGQARQDVLLQGRLLAFATKQDGGKPGAGG